MVWLLCDFKILLTVFNQSYNCQTSHYLDRNRLPKPFLILPSLLIFYLATAQRTAGFGSIFLNDHTRDKKFDEANILVHYGRIFQVLSNNYETFFFSFGIKFKYIKCSHVKTILVFTEFQIQNEFYFVYWIIFHLHHGTDYYAHLLFYCKPG